LAEVYSYSGGELTAGEYAQRTRQDRRIGAGEGEAETAGIGIPLFDNYAAAFTESGSYLVVITELVLEPTPRVTTKYQAGTSFNKGGAELNWQAMKTRPVASGGMTLAAALSQMDADKAAADRSYTLNGGTETVSSTIDLKHNTGSGDHSPKSVTLNGNGKTVRFTGSPGSALFNVFDVTLTLENITLEGCVNLKTGGAALVLGTGAIITGSTNSGGVEVAGTLTINGGIIAGNSSVQEGGGVFVAGTLTMNGGVIAGNSSVQKGGGVYVDGSGTLTMNGGIIADNITAPGGGVYVNGGTFTMNGGIITGNKAPTDFGGGVAVELSSGKFTMNGGTIADNAALVGGGVAVNYGKFTMVNGTISGNDASYSGGGVYLFGSSSDKGRFTMDGGTISGNDAAEGGGVLMDAYSTFTMHSGSVSLNTATGKGGGVLVGSATGTEFTMDGGSISRNEAATGGGVYIEPSGPSFTPTGTAAVQGNTPNDIIGP
jgi:hypothetical protein